MAPDAKFRLLSLRDAMTGRRIASVGIRYCQGEKRWEVFEAKPFANGMPTDAIIAAANRRSQARKAKRRLLPDGL